MYDQARRAQARTIAEARGISAAATVTGIGERTLRRWARAEGWQRPGRPGVARPPTAPEKEDGGHPAMALRFRNPARELAEDVDLTRQVFRQQLHALADGYGRPGWVRDVAVAHGIMLDKAAAQGGLGGWQGKDFTWAGYFTDNQARLARLQVMVEELAMRQEAADGDQPA